MMAISKETDIVVYDAIVRTGSLILMTLDNVGYVVSTLQNPDGAQEIIRILNEGKLAKIRAVIFGGRIINIISVNETNEKLKPTIIGELVRTSDRVRFWIDSLNNRYLITGESIKSAKLLAEGREGDLVAIYGFVDETRGIPILRYLHYQILKRREEMEGTPTPEVQKVETTTPTPTALPTTVPGNVGVEEKREDQSVQSVGEITPSVTESLLKKKLNESE